MNILTLTSGDSAKKIVIECDHVLALEPINVSLSQTLTRVYLKGGVFKDVAESVKTVKSLFHKYCPAQS